MIYRLLVIVGILALAGIVALIRFFSNPENYR